MKLVPALEGLAAAGLVTLTAACGSNTPASPSPTTFHADVTDPAGDAVAVPGVPVAPDLVHATVDVNGANITLAIQFASGTLDPATTRLTIELDTDQNPATGNLAAGPLGIDYIIDVWATRNPAVSVQQATPATCTGSGSCYVQTGTAPITAATDTLTTTVPLAMFGNASGRLNFRALVYSSTQTTTPAAVADVMPDITLPAAHIP
jgi:hypothetical protein